MKHRRTSPGILFAALLVASISSGTTPTTLGFNGQAVTYSNGFPTPVSLSLVYGDPIYWGATWNSCGASGNNCVYSFDFSAVAGQPYSGSGVATTLSTGGVVTAGAVGDFTMLFDSQVVANVHVVPVVVTVDAVGDVFQTESAPLVAHVNGSGSVTWSINDPAGGTITSDATGTMFTAGSVEGYYTVTARSTIDQSKSASVVVHVDPPPQVTVTPNGVTVASGASQQFSATVQYTSYQTVDWSVVAHYGGGNISDTGLFTAVGGGGPTYVEATLRRNGAFGTAQVNVIGVTISPSSPAVDVGTGLQFRAAVGGSTNQTVTWSTTAPGATINAAGYLQVPVSTAPGTYAVKATTAATPTAAATVSVAVHPATVGSVSVSPGRATVSPSSSRQFTATVYSDTRLPLSGERVSWTATPPATISSAGIFQAPSTAGTYTVTATSSTDTTKSASATITVPASISITPEYRALSPGSSVQLSATVSGLSDASVNWKVKEDGGGQVNAGFYTAPSAPGTYHVIASSAAMPSLDAVATMAVTGGAALFVDVIPDGVEMSRGATQQFSAVVEGTTDQTVTWAASAGTIDRATGSFTSPNAFGTVTVTATSVADSRAVGSATVVVSDGSAGQSFTYDANGNLLYDGVRQFQWDAENRLTRVVNGNHVSDFAYDGFGRRVLITETDSGTVTSRKRYIWVGNSIAQEISSPAAAGFATASMSISTMASVEATESVDLSGETSPGSKRSPQTTVSPTYDGSFDAADCSTLSGWAWDLNQPNTPINVDIYDNNTFLTSVPANIYNSALAGKGNGYHQFLWTVPASLKNGVAHSIYVRYGGTYTALPNSPRSITCSAASYEGSLDVASCSSIDGWAWDSTQPNGTVNVDVLDGTTVLATVPANIFRQDLLNAGKGNGYHGFHLNPPSTVIDGKAHSISARVNGSSYTLVGTPKSITCTPPSTTPLAAKFVSQSVPTSMAPGGVYSVSITFQNTGTNTWTNANKYRLGDASSTPGTWNLSRVDLASSDAIATGQSKTFTFNVLAPSTAGTYNFQWRMVEEFVAWFGDTTPNVAITVSGNPPRNAAFVSQSVPTMVGAGESFPVSVTMKNTGANTWTASDSYRLGDQSSNSPAISWGRARSDLSATDSIANGQTKTFTFTATAPATSGSYSFQWRMLQENVAWFGDLTPAVTIRVMPPVAASTATEWVTTEFYPGGMRADGANYYFLYDQLGSLRRVYDGTGSGALTSAFDYDPWGRLTIAAGTAIPKLGFAGYFYHQPSGLWLTKYRAYDPNLGRWISPDPAGEDADENLYRYSDDDPINEVDPLGLKCKPKHSPKGHPKHKKPPKKLPKVPLHPKGPAPCLMCRSPQVPLPPLPTTLPPLPFPPPYLMGYPTDNMPPPPLHHHNPWADDPQATADMCANLGWTPCRDPREAPENDDGPEDPLEGHHNSTQPTGPLPEGPALGLPPEGKIPNQNTEPEVGGD